ncbi:hypothetical protein [Clostridioides difficile]|nr:hypothetical protein [Clostridioides difficile]EQH27282.1 hypothetical protein QM1_0890 [Clostridioides difficile DA00212]
MENLMMSIIAGVIASYIYDKLNATLSDQLRVAGNLILSSIKTNINN